MTVLQDVFSSHKWLVTQAVNLCHSFRGRLTKKQRYLSNVMFGIHSRRACTAQEMSLERGNCVFPVSHVRANVPCYRGSFPYKFEQLAMQIGTRGTAMQEGVRFRSGVSKAGNHVEDHGQTS